MSIRKVIDVDLEHVEHDGCQCKRTAKGDNFLARYATDGPTKMLEDPDIRQLVEIFRDTFPDRSNLTDEQIVKVYARFLARKHGGTPLS